MNPRSPKKVIFLHIPKTAGMTLYQILSRQYTDKEIYTIGGLTELTAFKALEPGERNAYRLLRGHMEFGLHKLITGDVEYFTLLREPVSRVISYYNYLHQRPLDPMHKLIKKEKLSLTQFVERGIDPLVDNAQTRMLSAGWYAVPVGGCDEQMLARAKENLCHRFAVVGLTEKFDETLLLLQDAFGWRRLEYIRQNVTRMRSQKKEIPEEVLEKITLWNRLDIELYAYAETLFTAHIAKIGTAEFGAKLARFRSRNRRLSPFIRGYWKLRTVSVRALFTKFAGK